jgi:hypothetical protein
MGRGSLRSCLHTIPTLPRALLDHEKVAEHVEEQMEALRRACRIGHVTYLVYALVTLHLTRRRGRPTTERRTPAGDLFPLVRGER